MRENGLVPTVREQQLQGKSYWRVVVGPATSATEREQILSEVKDLGFSDAYFVSD